jgi:putative transcriptional regulator
MLGKLLIAHPLLNDGFFNRSVICIASHTDEESIGLILNFKTNYKLRDFRPELNNGNFPIYEGGPVSKNQLFFLHTLGKELTNSMPIKNNIYFGGDYNQLLHLINHNKVSQKQVRFFVGYCGWGAEQLIDEIKRKSWYLNSPKDIQFNTDETELWSTKLGEEKSSLKIFGEVGHDIYLN